MRQITSLCKNNRLISEYALLSENALENKSENGKLSLDPQESRKESTSWLTLAMACQSSWFDEKDYEDCGGVFVTLWIHRKMG